MFDQHLWTYICDQQGQTTSIENLSQQTLSFDESSLQELLNSKEQYTWVHMTYDHELNSEILKNLKVSKHSIETLTAYESRPGCFHADNEIILIIRGINTSSKLHPEHMVSLRIYIRDRLIITGRNTAWELKSIQEIKQLFDQGNGPVSIEYFMAELLERITDKIRDSVNTIEEDILTLEQDTPSIELAQILNARRVEIANLRRFLTPQKNALEQYNRLHKEGTKTEVYLLRNIIDRTQRYLEDIDLAKERIHILQEQFRNLAAQKQNDRMYLLSIITLIFLPLSFLTGVFGMNVGGLPGTENSFAFWIVTAIMTILSIDTLIWLKIVKWF